MKTCRSTLNHHLLACLAIVLVTFLFLNLDVMQPWREALGQTLGLPEKHLWILGCSISGILLTLLFTRTHGRLTAPFKSIADQCREGKLAPSLLSEQTREARIIRDYIYQIQDRADNRAIQLQEIEAELKNLRKERARNQRSIEEFEDLIAAYARIRSELTYDNALLRREIKKLESGIENTKQTPPHPERVQRFPFANQA